MKKRNYLSDVEDRSGNAFSVIADFEGNEEQLMDIEPAADSMTDSNIPGVAYATVYPIAMVFLILFIQVIALAVL